MKISPTIVLTTSGVFTPVATAFLYDTIEVMLPWILAMFAIILADLASGIRKSLKLKVHVSWTTAGRETMGKIVVYLAFVLAVAMVDVAAKGESNIAKWVCLLVCAMEGGSVISNLLRPYGIEMTPKTILKMFLKRSPLAVTDEEAEELLKKTRKRENEKWNHRRKPKVSDEQVKSARKRMLNEKE